MGDLDTKISSASAFDSDAIKAIHAFSTGSAAQHVEHREGSRLPQLWWVLTSRSWAEVPISVFLIEHRDGLVLFDTGLDPAIKSEPCYISSALGRFLLKRIFRFDIRPEDKLGFKVESLGYDKGRICKAIISHLHFDHVGGISDVPHAELLVDKREWEQLSVPHPEYEWILREHIELASAKWMPIGFQPVRDSFLSSFESYHDVMGDGSILLLPTPGHTRGSLSALIRTSIAPPILLVGDLAYNIDAIFNDRPPGTGDAKTLHATYAKVRQLKKQFPDLLIVPSHDFEAVDRLNAVLSADTN